MRPPCPTPERTEAPWRTGGTDPRRLPTATETLLLETRSIRLLEARFIPPEQPGALMAQAAASLARLATALAPHAPLHVFECGPGHNGGDGLFAAAILARQGRKVRVVPAFDPADPTALGALPDAVREAWHQALEAGCDVAPDGGPVAPTGSQYVDALLGIGASRPPEGRLLLGVQRLWAHRGHVLAVDVPTGLDADSGRRLGDAVVARDTLTFLAAKPGLFTAEGRDHAGRVWLDDLGLGGAVNEVARAPWIRLGGLAAAPPRRSHADHKGRRGDVLVVGGAPGMGGALDLAARAAHAAGAGRVWCVPLDATALHRPPGRSELMQLDVAALAEPSTLADRTVVVGCGGGLEVASALARVLRDAPRVVLDADGLNAVAADTSLRRALARRPARGGQSVLTPHPLEAARLLGCSAAQVQDNRLEAARQLAGRLAATVVLKGSGTVVATSDRIWINPTGGPALATPGSGDVLAGWIGGLWAPGGADDAWRACLEACRLHGEVAEAVRDGPLRAADLVEWMWARRAGAEGRLDRSA